MTATPPAPMTATELRTAHDRGVRPSAPHADLRGADLRDADLRHADLRHADLRGANLWRANLWGGLALAAGRSGDGCMVPTPDGWRITIGCWRHRTVDDLRDLIDDRAEWPEARGVEREFRRPRLRAVLALCEAHIAEHADLIDRLAQRWPATTATTDRSAS